jgi:hypothetical protein
MTCSPNDDEFYLPLYQLGRAGGTVRGLFGSEIIVLSAQRPSGKQNHSSHEAGRALCTNIHFSKYGSSSSSLSSEIIVLNVLPVNKTIPPIVHLLAACCPLDARSSILIILLLSLFFFFSRLLQMASIKPVVISTPPHLCADNCAQI